MYYLSICYYVVRGNFKFKAKCIWRNKTCDLHFFFFCSVLQDEDDIIPDLSEDESAILRMEDCEAFKCEVVSFGRQAYDLVAKSLLEEDIEKNK